MHTIARSHRIHIPRILTTCASSSSSSVAAASSRISVLSSLPSSSTSIISSTSSSSSSSSFNPIRSFAAAGGAAKKSKKAADATVAEPDLLVTNEYDEYNIVPPQPKPSAEELAQSCLTEEQLRFAKRPMPSSQHRTELLPAVYVGEKRIVEHSVEDLGKYYTVPTATLNSMPPNIHRTMSQEYMAGGPYHMIRSPGFEIVQALKKIENGGDEAKSVKQRVFGVRGESGCGKSAALHYACQFAREQTRMNPSKPWLLIGTRADEFTTETKGFIAPSPLKDGIYDQALYTMEFFKNMLKTESAALKKIKLKRWAVYDDKPIAWTDGVKGETLFDLVTLASTDREQAPRLLYEFVGELKHKTEIPVLVAIDNLNVWDQVCEFIEPYTYKKMDPRKLALVDAFNWFIERPPGNGASVWAITTKHATLNEAHRHFQRRDVLGLDSWWYSAKELRQCVVHYSVSEFILGEVNLDLLTRISGLTGKVPRDVFKQAFLR